MNSTPHHHANPTNDTAQETARPESLPHSSPQQQTAVSDASTGATDRTTNHPTDRTPEQLPSSPEPRARPGNTAGDSPQDLLGGIPLGLGPTTTSARPNTSPADAFRHQANAEAVEQCSPTTAYPTSVSPLPAKGLLTPAATRTQTAPLKAARRTHRPATRRVSRNQIIQLARDLIEHDTAVLVFLRDVRFATTHQLARAFAHRYTSHRSAVRQLNRTLTRLTDRLLVDRLPRRIGGPGKGSSTGIWYLTNTGLRTLDHLHQRITDDGGTDDHRSGDRSSGASRAGQNKRPVWWGNDHPSLTFLDHTLAVTELHVQLLECEHTKRISIDRLDTEPASWRRFLGPDGTVRTLKPDLAVITNTPDGFEDHWYLELDRATETPKRVLAQCQIYQQHRATGREQAARGGIYPAVLWIVPNTARRDQLTRHLHAATSLDTALFTVITLEDFTATITGGITPPAT